ncbi:MAG: ParA family protein [Syntrophobacteraceae bacterium]
MPGKVIAVVNHKGGCGKTTTTCNLANSVASRCKLKVLVIDNDVQCNTTAMLLSGVDFEHSLYNVYKENPIPIENIMVPTLVHENLYCLPNSRESATVEKRLNAINVETKSFTGYRVLRNRVREYAINNFDLIFVDNAPNLGIFVMNALLMADFALVPHEAGSRNSLDGLTTAIRFIQEIQSDPIDGNPDLKFLRVLVTMAKKRTMVFRALMGQLRRHLSESDVFKTIISDSTQFQQSELTNTTMLQLCPTAAGTLAYRDLADELTAILGMRPQAEGENYERAAN